ncbi:MAG: hypothetical protein PHR19_08545 [Bacteroidales bacterium]|nr:hypothetical protein [Bacteroidales bacterium]
MKNYYRIKNPRIRTLRGARKSVKKYEDEGYAAMFEKIKLKNGSHGYKVLTKKIMKVGDKNLTIYGKEL